MNFQKGSTLTPEATPQRPDSSPIGTERQQEAAPTSPQAAKSPRNSPCNAFGIYSFNYGDTIDSKNIGAIYLTAVQCARKITQIKNNKITNTTITTYLCKIESGLAYCWGYMQPDGVVLDIENKPLREDLEDLIQDCVCALIAFSGQVYCQEIARVVRNAAGNKIDAACRKADRLLAEQAEQENGLLRADVAWAMKRQAAAVDVSTPAAADADANILYTLENTFTKKEFIAQLKACEFRDRDVDLLVRHAVNGQSVREIAECVGMPATTVQLQYTEVKRRIKQLNINLLK